VVAAASTTGVTNALGKFGSLGGQTTSFRINNWQTAFGDLHGVHWLIGLGTNSFGLRHIDPTSVHAAATRPGYISNLPLQALYETGVLGVLLLALACGFLVVRSRRRWRTAALLACFLVVAVATSPFYLAYFWLLLASALVGERAPRPAAAAAADPPDVGDSQPGEPAVVPIEPVPGPLVPA
jgi:hypothetical protein